MRRNLLEYLDESEPQFPDKTAFTDGWDTLTFRQLRAAARAVGSFLISNGYAREPAVVMMDKHPDMIAAQLGVLYGGCFYVPLDRELSSYRVQNILDSLRPRVMIADEKNKEFAETLGFDGEIYLYAELAGAEIDEAALETARGRSLDTDIAYIVYTSGSTGVPKGVAASHRNVIDYIDALTDILRVDSATVFGNQTPLYVDASLKELYTTLKTGASTVIIPKPLFSVPLRLVEFLNEYKINTVCWVVSALVMISGFGVLDKIKPEHLKNVIFGSEVFPVKQFRLWRAALPAARFVNLYGPTETTGMCCWHEVINQVEDVIPIGKPFPNTEILLIADGKTVTQPNTQGEIYVRGSRVTLGYYGDTKRTAEAFVQNPTHTLYPETVYRTGDLAKYNADGDLIYISRSDHQIKHMGYRIELSEIEAAACDISGVAAACCVFDAQSGRLTLWFTGEANSKTLSGKLRACLPRYMLPARIQPLDAMPLTLNGKIDRVELTNRAKGI